MSMAKTIQPRSDQMNNADLLSGDRILTITKVVVREDDDDQPVSIWFAEFPEGRPFKPGLTVRRILVVAWGDDEQVYVGRRLHLYRDPEVTFGRDKPGGIRVKAMSHIPKRFAVTLATSKGKVAPYVIEPLAHDAPTSPPLSETDVRRASLRAEWEGADDERREAIKREVAALDDPALIEDAFETKS
jgi:hypothetical protein